MIITSFEQIKENMHVNTKRTVAVASAVEDKTLEAVMRAHDEGLVDYILTGPADEIIATADKIGRDIDKERIVDTADDQESAAKRLNWCEREKRIFCKRVFCIHLRCLKLL